MELALFKEEFFFWYKARQFFTCAVKWNHPFYSPSLRTIYILYYVMHCFSFSWLPSLHIYTTDPHPRGFPCDFVTHRPSMFMNLLRTHPFLPATFTAQTKNVTIKIFQIQKKINKIHTLSLIYCRVLLQLWKRWVLLQCRQHRDFSSTVLEKGTLDPCSPDVNLLGFKITFTESLDGSWAGL